MSKRIRTIIGEKISQYIKEKNIGARLELPPKKELTNATAGATLQLLLVGDNDVNSIELSQVISGIKFDTDLVKCVKIQPAVSKNSAKFEFQIQPQAFVEDVLRLDAGKTPLQANIHKPHVVVEFSSPNIAKPFHVGHLRSTIIGNAISNLHRQLDYRVTNLNYLGDWGTQFGLLQVGVEMEQLTEVQMQEQPIECLYRAYVRANMAAKSDPSIAVKARQYFTALESGSSPEVAKQWAKYRQYTIAELEQVYARLGVVFQQYDWESQYSQVKIGDILQQLELKSLLLDEHDGRKIVQVDGRRVPIIKSDGSTLYLARDIAALLDRFQRYNFERIIYVVDNAQTDHFNACFKTTAALCGEKLPIERMIHVKFGRIHGMSTRSGNAIFLRNVLDEARDVMLEKQLQSPTTKVDLVSTAGDFKSIADILGVSAVIINDLKQRRQRDYEFDWNKALQVNGDTGIKMQYTHCRLCNLLENVADINVDNVLPSMAYLSEPEAQDLLLQIARYEQTVWKSKEQLEACILVSYLFALCNSTSRALKQLNIKHETSLEKQQNRILLFNAAKKTLSNGMLILGLNPLTKM